MRINIDAAPSGYSITIELDNGTTRTYPNEVHSLRETLGYSKTLADEVEKETGGRPEVLISQRAIRENKSRDIDARRVWDNPDFSY